MKKTWRGETAEPVVRVRAIYDEQGALVGSTHGVNLTIEVGDEQKERGRLVTHHMSPEMARQRAAELVAAADEADEADARNKGFF